MIVQRGFTLLEVMVATTILGVGLVAVSGSIATAVRSAALANGYEQARQIAESRLALFLATRPQGTGNSSGIDGVISWSISARPHSELAGLLDVSVEASFFAAGGKRTLSLHTLEASRAINQP